MDDLILVRCLVCLKYGCLEEKHSCDWKTLNFIRKAREKHKFKYNYSKTVYEKSKTKLRIDCLTHGEFLQTPNSHVQGRGCSKCSKRYSTLEEWIIEANKLHKNKYNYSKVVYTNGKTKISIICQEHGEFNQTPNDHLQRNGCPKCGGTYKYTTGEWIVEARKKHGNIYDYSSVVYVDAQTKVLIICRKHGAFSQTPNSHLQGHGCSRCAGNYIYTTEEWVTEAKKIHSDRYDYSKTVYTNAKTNVIIICLLHGEFHQTADHHTRGNGCPRCGRKFSTTEEWIVEAKKVHGDKYDYSKTFYINGKTNITIICRIHGEFFQRPRHHLWGCGCSKCLFCPSCGLWRTKGILCQYCKPQSKLRIKTKELEVVKYLKTNLPDEEFIHNKSVGNTCTDLDDEKECGHGNIKKECNRCNHLYPDILFDRVWYHLIVEIDEFKHRGADYSCDQKRMFDIIAKLGQPCIFVRYNPDSKESNKEELLKMVNKYLQLTEDETPPWDDHGFYSEYLFY
jgi:hypothetical protein